MHARYYSPVLARFVSVDPVSGDIGSSQSWNRYSYVQNNPQKFIDPNGEALVAAHRPDLYRGDDMWTFKIQFENTLRYTSGPFGHWVFTLLGMFDEFNKGYVSNDTSGIAILDEMEEKAMFEGMVETKFNELAKPIGGTSNVYNEEGILKLNQAVSEVVSFMINQKQITSIKVANAIKAAYSAEAFIEKSKEEKKEREYPTKQRSMATEIESTQSWMNRRRQELKE